MKNLNKLVALVGSFAVAGAVVAAPANASSFDWICDVLDAQPNKAGVVAVIRELIDQGYTKDNGGPEIFATTVINECPDLIPAVDKAVSQLT